MTLRKYLDMTSCSILYSVCTLNILSSTNEQKGLAHAMPYTVNEGPVKIQYKCLVPIYVFPEMKLCGLIVSKTEL
jgi:hypothetical protein